MANINLPISETPGPPGSPGRKSDAARIYAALVGTGYSQDEAGINALVGHLIRDLVTDFEHAEKLRNSRKAEPEVDVGPPERVDRFRE